MRLYDADSSSALNVGSAQLKIDKHAFANFNVSTNHSFNLIYCQMRIFMVLPNFPLPLVIANSKTKCPLLWLKPT